MTDGERAAWKMYVKSFYDAQRKRIDYANRLHKKKNNDSTKGEYKELPLADRLLFEDLLKNHQDIEKVILKAMCKKLESVPIWKEYLKDVPGVGPTMAALIVSEFDIEKWITVSKGWKFAGLHVENGKALKPIKGEKLCWNKFLRSKLLGVLGPSFLKCNSPYREYYDNMKHRLESKNWGVASKNPTDKSRPKAGHQHNAAIRYMVKMFLKDLYVAWRTLEGLDVRPPYNDEYGNGHHSE